MTDQTTHPFDRLTPSFIMDAIESLGYVCDCRTFALNSYENRVYQVGIEDGQPLIAKFYRPARWSDEQIREEHQFCFELVGQELPVVAPLTDEHGESLFSYGGFRFTLYPRKGGHAPELDNLDNLYTLGTLMGRIHLVGASRPFEHRPAIDSQGFGHQSVALISERFIPIEYKATYDAITADLLSSIDEILERTSEISWIRTHGDCHTGNMLWRDDAPHFVDFDDARMAPAIQDLWMLLSGDRPRQLAQLSSIMDGYGQFYDLHPREFQLIEVLRTLRMLHYSAWLANRWEDPAFPRSFPWFNTVQYWGEHMLQLREQMSALQEPALTIQC
jgi:Ser/Thr protein kinase RdoA (MazF antagonist)